jgi:hypothetical protein
VQEVGPAKYGGIVVLDKSAVAAEHAAQVAQWMEAMVPKDLHWETDGMPATNPS